MLKPPPARPRGNFERGISKVIQTENCVNKAHLDSLRPHNYLKYNTQVLYSASALLLPLAILEELMPERDGSSTTTSTWGGTTTELNGDNIIQTARENSESRESIPGRSENRRNTETEKSEGGMNGHTTTTGPDSVEITASDKHQDRRRSSTTAEVHHINPLGLQIRSRPGRGNGVFATVRISAGTLVEESPVLLISAEQWEKGDMQRTIFGEYGFCWSGGGQAIGLGLGEYFLAVFRIQANVFQLRYSITLLDQMSTSFVRPLRQPSASLLLVLSSPMKSCVFATRPMNRNCGSHPSVNLELGRQT